LPSAMTGNLSVPAPNPSALGVAHALDGKVGRIRTDLQSFSR
jgi:hypothetical protein